MSRSSWLTDRAVARVFLEANICRSGKEGPLPSPRSLTQPTPRARTWFAIPAAASSLLPSSDSDCAYEQHSRLGRLLQHCVIFVNQAPVHSLLATTPRRSGRLVEHGVNNITQPAPPPCGPPQALLTLATTSYCPQHRSRQTRCTNCALLDVVPRRPRVPRSPAAGSRRSGGLQFRSRKTTDPIQRSIRTVPRRGTSFA